MKNNDWKQQLSIVYSTNPDFGKEDTEEEQETALPPSEQRLKILLDKKNRKGKEATIITGFIGSDNHSAPVRNRNRYIGNMMSEL